jgi:hypothetical protein
MEREDGQLGYFRFSGELVANGYLDARKSAQALLGIDDAVRFFISQHAPDLRNRDFELPVKVRKGSWEVVIGGILIAYGVKAAQKMAENDFKDVGIKDVVKKSLAAVQWTIRIGKHMGDLTIKKFENLQFQSRNELVGISNLRGEILYVPREYLYLYSSASPDILRRLAQVIEDQRTLSVGVYEDDRLIEETVTRDHRSIFTREEEFSEPEEILFPELEHGQEVVIDGEVTRGNEMSNTLGIKYKGHILTAIPEVGSIVRVKTSLFLRCRIHGRISREDKSGLLNSRRPRVVFSHIEPLESDELNPSLF